MSPLSNRVSDEDRDQMFAAEVEGDYARESSKAAEATDDSILAVYEMALASAKHYQEIAQRLEYEIIRRAQERGATAVESPDFRATITGAPRVTLTAKFPRPTHMS